MKTQVNRSQDLIKLLKTEANKGIPSQSSMPSRKGMKVVTADSTTTLIFEGSVNPVTVALFDIPAEYLPLEPSARYFALPIEDKATPNRWGIIQRLDNSGMSGQLQVSDGTSVTTYTLKNGIFITSE